MSILDELLAPEDLRAVRHTAHPERTGRVDRIVGMHAEITGLRLATGDLVIIGTDPAVTAEVVAVGPGTLTALPLGSLHGVHAGEIVRSARATLQAPVGPSLVGRVLDGLGQPMDGKGGLGDVVHLPLQNQPPPPLDRPLVIEQLQTGVRAIDGLLSIGKGRHVGIMAGSGVGKSSLLSMLLAAPTLT